MTEKLTLVSFDLCPYVQRAAIVLAEKQVPFDRIDIDLEKKPDWFRAISPSGKVPLLKVGDEVLFESAAIVEYLDKTHAPRLHPENPVSRARHRAWMEFGSAILADIWTMETTTDRAIFDKATLAIHEKLSRVEAELSGGPFFAGEDFTLVDAIFAPIFRYFDVFDQIGDFGIFDNKPKTVKWRSALAARPSVIGAVASDYNERLQRFLAKKKGVITSIPVAA